MKQYTVKQGDTLSAIAQQMGVPDYHQITGYSSGNPDLIMPGEELSVPDTNPVMQQIKSQTQPISEIVSPTQTSPVIQPTQKPDSITQPPTRIDTPKTTGVIITSPFGNPNPADVFSGGINTGTDVAADIGTPVALPQGKWRVLSAFGDASGAGYVGNGTNQGYGNSVLVQNTETGEKIRMSHLNQINVREGDEIPGGIVGATGATGNVTGPHLDIEYYDPNGNLSDIQNSPYAPRRGK